MIIILSPVAAFDGYADETPDINGDIISYRGQSFDLSQLDEGSEVEADLPFIGKIKRVNGVVHCALQYMYNALLAEDYQSTDWSDYTFTVTDGQCPDPIKYKPELTSAL